MVNGKLTKAELRLLEQLNSASGCIVDKYGRLMGAGEVFSSTAATALRLVGSGHIAFLEDGHHMVITTLGKEALRAHNH